MSKAVLLGKSGKADLPKELFAEPFHQSLVHEAARADMASRRRGTASTLTRGEVSFTTAKAWRQKGTGRARVGALGVSSRYGGGVTFGPKPRHYTVKVNRKARRRAGQMDRQEPDPDRAYGRGGRRDEELPQYLPHRRARGRGDRGCRRDRG